MLKANMIYKLVSLLSVITVVLFTGCRSDQFVEIRVPQCDTTWYQRVIRPIITQNCSISGCHDGTNSIPNFNEYLMLKDVIDTKINGKAKILYRIDLPLNDSDHMPNNGQMLSSVDRTKLVTWINAGYPGCDQ